jgi:hypothetical protein
MKIFCFGDSWAAGAELTDNENPFVHWMAQSLKVEYVNYGVARSSLGIILHTLISKIGQITKDDIVIVVVPPDTRWYDENKRRGFYSLSNWSKIDYFKFLNDKTLEWFTYHHALFIYSIQKLLDDIGCRYILAHNYGQIDDYKKYNLFIDYSKFLSPRSLTDALTENCMNWKSYPDHLLPEHRYDQSGPPPTEFFGIYFEGCISHPNELGHKKIAEMMLTKLQELNEHTTR